MIALLWVLGSFTLLYLVTITLIAFASVRPLRIPQFISPSQLGLPQERVEIDSEEHKLRGWWVRHPDAEMVIIALHGYINNRCELAPYALPFFRERCSSLFMDFRAQGRSTGNKCTFGHKERADVRAMVEFVRREQPGVRIVLFGSSMGAAAAALAAGDEPSIADALILDGVYRSLDEASGGWWTMIGGRWLQIVLTPVAWIGMLYLGFRPRTISVEKALGKLAGKPMLFLQGTDDPLVPRASAEANVRAAGEFARIAWFEGAGHGHGRFQDSIRFENEIVDFLRNVRDSAQKG